MQPGRLLPRWWRGQRRVHYVFRGLPHANEGAVQVGGDDLAQLVRGSNVMHEVFPAALYGKPVLSPRGRSAAARRARRVVFDG